MKKLSQESFQRARAYIMGHGRELDRRLYAFHFEDGSRYDVLSALSSFQNPDGGFGRALEPDLRTTASSAIATQQGFNILTEVHASAGDKLVRRGIDYLVNTFDEEMGVWPIVPPEVEEEPHAPWWSYADSAETFDDFRANPRAALVGHLNTYASLVPTNFLVKVTDEVLDHLDTQPKGQMEIHDLHCFQTLAESVTGSVQDQVVTKLSHVVAGSVENDPDKWSDYNLRPLAVASTPEGILYPFLDRWALDANLDYEINQQSIDGSWPLTWSWAFVDEAAWAQAETDWKGHHAVRKLRTLLAYGRIDELS